MARPIQKQVIVITGGTSGIGLGTALAAARRGARVAVCGRDRRALRAAVREIRRQGGKAIGIRADVTRYDDMKRLAGRTVRAFGRIDTWINNAGVTAYATFTELSLEDAHRIVDVNFIGQLNGAKAALPHLERSRGALICIGSALADRGMPLQSVYSASKHALKGWIDALRLELRKERIPVRVTLIKPSAINTPLYSNAKTQLGILPRPIRPVYDPQMVVKAILRAATGNVRDMHVGGSGKLLSIGERINPQIVDRVLQGYGFAGHRSKRPKSSRAASNLYRPAHTVSGVHGEFGDDEHRHSLYQAVATHRMITLGVVAGVVAAVYRSRERVKPIEEARDAPGPIIRLRRRETARHT